MYGRSVLTANSGFPIQVTADGDPDWKTGGATIDWPSVVAVSGSAVTLPNGLVIPIGSKYLRFGQVMTRITSGTVQTLSITGTPTGGTFTISIVEPDTGVILTTAAIAYNANAAAVQAALDAILNPGVVTVTGTNPNFTLTFTGAYIPAAVTTTNAFVGGTVPNTTIAITTVGASGGKFGPYDPNATDGRQNLTRDGAGILNETIVQARVNGVLTTVNTDHTGLIVAGRLFKGRVLMTAGTHSLAAGPTVAEVEAVFPQVSWVTAL
jgi:flagellar hook-associated protein FlgK